jgi:hypothetical protein
MKGQPIAIDISFFPQFFAAAEVAIIHKTMIWL